jgi:hypothetical protein
MCCVYMCMCQSAQRTYRRHIYREAGLHNPQCTSTCRVPCTYALIKAKLPRPCARAMPAASADACAHLETATATPLSGHATFRRPPDGLLRRLDGLQSRGVGVEVAQRGRLNPAHRHASPIVETARDLCRAAAGPPIIERMLGAPALHCHLLAQHWMAGPALAVEVVEVVYNGGDPALYEGRCNKEANGPWMSIMLFTRETLLHAPWQRRVAYGHAWKAGLGPHKRHTCTRKASLKGNMCSVHPLGSKRIVYLEDILWRRSYVEHGQVGHGVEDDQILNRVSHVHMPLQIADDHVGHEAVAHWWHRSLSQ